MNHEQTLKRGERYYAIAWADEQGRQVWRKTTGRPVKIEGWEHMEFFAHHDKYSWSVSEVSTGRRLAIGGTKEATTRRAKLRLDSIGKKKVRNLLATYFKAPGK